MPEKAAMKILLVTWYFPPSRTIAAVRLGKMARYLLAQGHDIKVLTPREPPLPQNLNFDFPAERVIHTAWVAPDRVSRGPSETEESRENLGNLSFVDLVAESIRSNQSTSRPGNTNTDMKKASNTTRLKWIKQKYWYWRANFGPFPDKRVTWYPFALRGGSALLADWRPDLIYASGPPFTTLLIGQELSQRNAVPLVAEFRDRWSDDPYSPPFFWRRWRNYRAESRLIERATGLVTVSEPWAATYRARYQKPTTVVYNGYDAEFCNEGPYDGAVESLGLEIVYTGGIYPGYRDPSPLFAAMKRLDEQGLICRMIFHGPPTTVITDLAEAQGVTHLVDVGEVLTHEAALKRQRASDILVLMQWDDPKEQGNVPGKFFEYLGARRPILVLGLKEGVPAKILRERDAGFFSNDPTEIAQQLTRWLRIKQERGLLPAVPKGARAGFARDEQYARLVPFLEEVLE